MIRHRAAKPRPAKRHRPQLSCLERRVLLYGPTDVLMFHNDLSGTAANLNETQVTPQNVNPTSFGKLMSLPLDGYAYAQPLYVNNLTLPDGTTPNVVFAATEHDSVYAFDADTGTQLWKDSFIDPANGINPVPGGASSVVLTSDVVPEIGITGTPVIDSRTNRLFVVTKTQDANADGTFTYVQQLHALDIATGADVIPPTTIGATTLNSDGSYTNNTNVVVPGTGTDAVNGQVFFNALRSFNRPALVLSPNDPSDPNGVVYVAFSSHGDNKPYHGWVLGYDAKTLQLVNLYNDTPDGSQSGIWESGSGPTIDAQGNVIFAIGNGTMDAFVRGPSGGPLELGQGGGGLGYQGIGNSVAVKFDSYKPGGNHSSTGYYTAGHSPDVPPNVVTGDVYNDLAGTGIDFNAASTASPAHTYQATLSYDGSTLTETITDQTTNASASFSYPGVSITQQTGSNTAYVGFGGGTGGSNSIQDVLNWTYTAGATSGTPTIDHSAGFASHSDLTNNGSATYVGAAARLTDGNNNEAGTIFTNNPVDVTKFTTAFTFQMRAGSNPIADGLTFIIQNNPYLSTTPPGPDYSESVLKLKPAAPSSSGAPGMSTVVDSFTPYTFRTLDTNDTDLGSGAVLLLPDLPGKHPHLAVETGKSGEIYLLDRDNLGGLNSNPAGPDNVYQEAKLGPQGIWASPIYWNNAIYYQGANDIMRMIPLVYDPASQSVKLLADSNGNAITTSVSSDTFGYPGGHPSLSANGDQNGIVWGIEFGGYATQAPEVLHAYDATDLSKEIYRSDTFTSSNLGPGYGGSNNRDTAGGSVKFVTPTISNGRVFVPAEYELDVYGLFAPNTAPPDAPPSGLTATALRGNQIQLSWTSNPADATAIQVLRSTDNVTFTPVGTVGPDTTAFTDKVPNASTLFYYELVALNQVGKSAPSPALAIRSSAALPIVTVTDIAAGAISLSWTNAASDPSSTYTVERSTDGGATYATLASGLPATATSYTDPTTVQGPTYLYRVTAVNPLDRGVSDPVQAKIGPVTIDHSGGFITTSDLQFNGSALASTQEQLARLTNNFSQAGSVFTTQKVGDRAFHTEFQIRLHEGTQAAGIADGLTFTLQSSPARSTALGNSGGDLGYGGITNSIAVKFDVFQNGNEPSPSTTGVFLNGASPQGGGPNAGIGTSQDTLQYGINLRDQHTKDVVIDYDGTTLTETITDTLTGASHTFTYTVNIPGAVGDAGYAGFTGASGATDYTLEDILNWKYVELDGGLAAPRAPSNLVVTDVTNNSVALRWDSNNAYTATGYSIERSTTPQFTTNVVEVARIGPNGDTFTDTSVTPGTYYYRVRSFAGTPPVYSTYSNVTGVAATIDHSAGFASNGDLTTNGSAKFVPVGSSTVARLTDQGANEAGTIFADALVNVASFTTSFVFQLHDGTPAGDKVPGNGITFVIQGNGLTALGPNGGGLGYGPDHHGGSGGIPNSVAVKFDTINNEGEGTDSTGLYLNGAPPTIPFVDLSKSPINLRSGDPFRVDLSYDGTTLTETITDTVTAGTFTTQYTVDIPAAVGRNFAYAGFSGGTGGHQAFQDIQTWTFSTGTGGAGPTGGTGPANITPADAPVAAPAIGTDPTPSSAAGETTGSSFTAAAAFGASAVPFGSTATDSPSAPDSPAPDGPSAPSPLLQVTIDPEASLPVRTKVKMMTIDGYLDDLAASLA